MATTLYHVAPKDHKGDILSLHQLHGDDAYAMYAEKWPESGDLSQYHAHYIHLYDTLAEAEVHARDFGGKVYAIDAEAMADDFIEVERDKLEFDHPMVRDCIPAEFCKVVA